MSPRVRLAVFCAVAATTLGSAAAVWASTSSHASAAKSNFNIVAGKKDYRQFCGQCHALAAALAAGFGAQNKFGQDGGPSFDDLRVSYSLSVQAITGSFAGHEIIVRKMTWQQIYDVSAFVQVATIKHPTVAKISDG